MIRQKINFDMCDFGARYDKNENFFVRVLRERFDIQLATSPDYLLYCFGTQVHRLYTCKKIYFTPEVDLPDFSQCDYALTSRYVDDPRHFRLPYYVLSLKPETLVKQPGEWEQILRQKTKFCCFMASYANRKTRLRTEFFQKLNQRKKVDSAGRALNNIGFNVPFQAQAKNEFLRPYKFYLAFENQSIPGYVTEKLIDGMRARCVPIYYGCPRVAEEFNPKSFLNYHDFPSEESLIDRVMEIDGNDDLYAQYLKEPFFLGDKPPVACDKTKFLDFFEGIFSSTTPPLAARKRLLGRWMLIKRNFPHLPLPKQPV
jgi:alpha(1,3/1,4) fucosyltransferase